MEQGTKKCSNCGRDLPLDKFTRNALSKDGLRHKCKDCEKEEAKTVKQKKLKVYTNPELAKFQPRELMDELRARGFRGELEWIKKVKI